MARRWRARLRVAAIIAAGCGAASIGCGAGSGAANMSGGDAPAAAREMSTDTRYPALYREMDLPELPDAEVMSTGRQETSLRDGLAIRVTTTMAVQATRDFISQALTDGGWEVAASRPLPGISVANVTGTKGGVTYTATITSSGEGTGVSINVLEN